MMSAGKIRLAPDVLLDVSIMADDFRDEPYQQLLGAIEGMGIHRRIRRLTFMLTSAGPLSSLPVLVLLPVFYAVVITLGILSMGFQLLASRLLSPHFGSSIIVWAWLISTFLAAFSLGSMLGRLDQ